MSSLNAPMGLMGRGGTTGVTRAGECRSELKPPVTSPRTLHGSSHSSPIRDPNQGPALQVPVLLARAGLAHSAHPRVRHI